MDRSFLLIVLLSGVAWMGSQYGYVRWIGGDGRWYKLGAYALAVATAVYAVVAYVVLG